jgi:hypothetical protein
MPIETIEQLHEHLALAAKVELSTIPPYLFAMYSIEDQSSESALLIRSIVAEEMLHAALVTNVLLAVGGNPRFDGPETMPTYPEYLPHHDPPLLLSLASCSTELLRDVFMRIEQPEIHGAPAQPDVFETLGQFYHALENALRDLSQRYDLFAEPQADRQLADPSFYSPVAYDAEDSGGLMLVDDFESAFAALEIIVHQGEGLSEDRWADPEHKELTHYHKLLQIMDGESPLGPVRPLRPNPRTADFPEELRPVSDLFNAVYRYFYIFLDNLFQPSADKGQAVGKLYGMMMQVLSPLALFLVEQPIGGGEFAAPTFEVFDFKSDQPEAEIAELAASVAERHPEFAGIGEIMTG